MHFFLILISIACGCMILTNTGQKRFNWCIGSMLMMSSSLIILNSPQLPVHRFFILCFWLSVLYRKEYRGCHFPLFLMLIFYSLGQIFVGLNAERLTLFYRVWKPFSFLLESYLVLLAFFYGGKNVSVNSKPLIYVLYFFTLFGIFTYIIKDNPYHRMLNYDYYASYLQEYCFGTRIRINSTWSAPIPYGFVCSLFFWLLFPYRNGKRIAFLLGLLMTNVLICGSRTSLAVFLLMGLVFFALRYHIRKSLRMLVYAIFIVFFSYLFVPYVQNKVDQLVSTVMGTDNMGGSSLEMRNEQTIAALYLFSKAPIIGYGPDYIGENLISDKLLLRRYYQQGYDFRAFESYAYVLLIERGLVGVVLEIMILLSILYHGLLKRKKDLESSAYIVAILIGFTFFALATGKLDTFPIAMLFIGLFIRRKAIGIQAD